MDFSFSQGARSETQSPIPFTTPPPKKGLYGSNTKLHLIADDDALLMDFWGV